MKQATYHSAGRVPGLDNLRALAITLVFVYHYRLFAHPAWVDTIGSFGWTGVDLFFVLSGYLIAAQIFKGLAAGTFSLRVFFLKRFFRILPAYWTVLLLYFLWPGFREWESLPPFWKLLTFTQNFGLDLRHHRTFSHAWSLCIEEQFYLLLPLSLLLLHRARAGAKAVSLLPALCLAGAACRLLSWRQLIAPATDTDAFGAIWYKWMYYPTYNRLDGLLAGIGIAAAFQYNGRLKAYMLRYANRLLAAGFVLITGAYLLCEVPVSFNASVFGFPLIAAAYGCMVASAAGRGGVLNSWSSAVTSTLATLSYATYLTHKAAIHFAQAISPKLGLEADGSAAFLLSIIIALAAAALLHYSIERPFLRLKELVLRNAETDERLSASHAGRQGGAGAGQPGAAIREDAPEAMGTYKAARTIADAGKRQEDNDKPKVFLGP